MKLKALFCAVISTSSQFGLANPTVVLSNTQFSGKTSIKKPDWAKKQPKKSKRSSQTTQLKTSATTTAEVTGSAEDTKKPPPAK
jgi:hypothetical protein